MIHASRTLKEALKRFGTYAASEDLQLEKMIDRMKGYPYCRNSREDLKMMNLFEAKLVTILQLNNSFHMSHSTAKSLISKISSVPHRVKYVDALNDLKGKNGDKNGVQNYVETLQYLLGMARTAAEESLDVEEINDRNIGISRFEEDGSSR